MYTHHYKRHWHKIDCKGTTFIRYTQTFFRFFSQDKKNSFLSCVIHII